ncbi:MAG: redoxin domain-containing protein [Cytophagaceae bacterium]|nr:redoxin domain-containing protein [Cytophagaceae bacterium]
MREQVFDPAFWDTEIKIQKNNSRIFPLQKGAKVQNFEMEIIKSSNLKSVEKRMSEQYFKSGIKVLSFLPNCWNEYARTHLARLNESSREIKALGGETCLVVNAAQEQIFEFFDDQKPEFSVIRDNDFRIAGKFGVFSEHHQPWQFIPGIQEDGPFPGIFVINKKSEIGFSYVDQTFERPFSFLEVAVAVYAENQKQNWQHFEFSKKSRAYN